jgi:hypothetical protein
MGNRKKLKKDRLVHALLAGSKSKALCSKRTTERVTTAPEEVTCQACGEAAAEALRRGLEAAEAAAHERQRSALAPLQRPRWWEKQTGGHDG